MSDFRLPSDNVRIKRVQSFEELVSTPFADGVNAFCWERALPGGFGEIMQHLAVRDGITTLDEEELNALPVSEEGKAALAFLIADQRLLREHGLAPDLDRIDGYLRDGEPGPVPTDVYSFHVDSATAEADTYLCTYVGPASEGLLNEAALRRVDVPETRAELLKLFGGEDDEAFIEYLHDNCFDLHYVPVAEAQPFGFGLGNLWRIAVEYPGSPVPPCIHRAPKTLPGDPPRLLLIS